MELLSIIPKWEERKRTLLVCAFLACAVFAAFEGVRSNDFVYYDDDKYISGNNEVLKGLSIDSLRWAFTTGYQANWHPLTWVSHLIDVSVFGLNPAGHHLVSVGFHIANVILLFLILKKMTSAVWLSAFVAAVFGLHPLGVESVAWAAERKNVLSSFFAFLTIWAYLLYAQKPGLWRYSAMTILFTAGLLSKSMLVTLPFVLILLDYWPIIRFGEIKGWQWLWRAIVDKLPLLAISAVFCVITYLVQAKAGAVPDMVSLPISLRASNALMSYIRYIGKIFYPTPLAALYPLDANGYLSWKVILCLVLLLALTTAVIVERRRYKFLVTGWFWYLGTLVPVIGLVQVGVQAMADRYMYLPGIGIYIIIAWFAGEISTKLRLPKIFLTVTGTAILLALLLMTRLQVEYWKNSESLFKHTLDVTTKNYVMQNNYGEFLRESGRVDEAIENFRQALAVCPMWIESHEKLARALQDKGQDDEAVAEFDLVLRTKPDKIEARICYANALVKIKQYDKAFEQFDMVLAKNPRELSALNNLYKAGVESGQIDKTLGMILNLQAKDPNNFEFCQKAGLLYGIKGDINTATEQLEKACKLSNYQLSEPMAFLSQAYAAQKDFKNAIDMAQKALSAAQKEGRDDVVTQLKASLESYQQKIKEKQ